MFARGWEDVYVGDLKENGSRLDSPKPLTSSDSLNRPRAWMPDSATILFVSSRMGVVQAFKQRIDADTPELLARAPNDQLLAMLSPDAKWILFLSYIDGESVDPPSEALMRLPASGGSPEHVMDLPVDPVSFFGCPSRSSASCVVSRWEQSQYIFYLLDPIQGQGKEIIRTKLPHADDYCWWSISPDGSSIAVFSPQQRGSVRILDLRKGAERDLELPTGWLIGNVSWAADSNALFVSASLPRRYIIARVDLNGKTDILLEHDAVFAPTASPDGRYLAYSQATTESNLWLLENF